MSNEMNGGSDLDIFEGLGKKASERLPAAPPPPPGSSAHVPAAKPMADAKRTLLGVAVPPPPTTDRSAAAPVAPPSERRVSAPPPLPPSERRVSAPPPIPTTPSTRPSPETSNAAPALAAPEAPAAAVAPPPAARPASVPPPPPGRASLPNFVPPGVPASTRPSSTPLARPSAPPALSTRPAAGVTATPASPAAPEPDPIAGDPTVVQPKTLVKNGAKLDMDWDDDQEATQVFDKESSKVDPDASAQALIAPAASEPERASMDLIMAAPAAGTGPTSTAPTAVVPPMTSPLGTSPLGTSQMAASPSPAAASATLSGAFGALGQPRTNGVPSQRYSAPPATQPAFTAPPAPPPGSIKTAPMSVTPPPPPGQVTTAPMHMPLQPNMAAPHADTMQSMQSPLTTPPTATHTSAPPPALVPSVPPPSLAPQLPPVSRAMDQTHMVPRVRPNRTPLIAGVVGVVAAAALGTFLLMPRTGTLVVNVADSKGGVVSNLEVSVDGKKACDSAPCIVRDISAGVHEVKVTAKGYELSAPRAVTVEGRKDQTSDFTLTAAKTSSGTGFKVASSHNGVKLSVDGKDIGLLPQELRDVSPGEHTLRFSGERYAPLEKHISVAKDEIVDLGSVNLKVLKGKATIQLGTPGAKVYIVNGPERKEVPQLPVAIEFGPNEKWELLGTKDGFDDFREPISFDDGQADKTFTVSLSPKGTAAATPRTVTPSAPAFVAAAPAREPAAPVAKAAPPPAPAESPKPAKAEAPAAAAATGEAVLKINSLPASNVVLDGKPLGMTPQAHVTVTPGSHTVMFVNSEQGLKKTITVDVKAGETKAAFAKLRE